MCSLGCAREAISGRTFEATPLRKRSGCISGGCRSRASPAGRFRRFVASFSRKSCAHDVLTDFDRCAICDARNAECITFLEALLPVVKAYYRSRDYWTSLDPYGFERAIGTLYQRLGWATEVTRGSGDRGADVLLRRGQELVVVQCKHHGKPVGPGAARDLLGTAQFFGAGRSILVSPAGFTRGVHELARTMPLELVDLEGILALQLSCDEAPSQRDRLSAG